MTDQLGVSGSAGRWVGVLRRNDTVVAKCPHIHSNRDAGATPARRCAEQLYRAATHPHHGQELRAQLESKALREADQARNLGADVSDEDKLEALHDSLRRFGWDG